MLEHAVLLIRPWRPHGTRESRAWVVEPCSATPLGFARRDRPRGPAWLSWLRPLTLAIHEADDEPLLLTLRRGLSPWPTWHVRDAEGHSVGRVGGQRLHDAHHGLIGFLRRGEPAVYRGAGRDVAVAEDEAGGVRLTFLLGEGASPFVKMVLLAAVLVHKQDVLEGRACHGSAAGAFSSRG
jgi:hypothetical protein